MQVVYHNTTSIEREFCKMINVFFNRSHWTPMFPYICHWQCWVDNVLDVIWSKKVICYCYMLLWSKCNLLLLQLLTKSNKITKACMEKRLDVMSVSVVRLYVCLSVRISRKLHSHTLPNVCVDCGCCSVLLWRCCNTLYACVFLSAERIAWQLKRLHQF